MNDRYRFLCAVLADLGHCGRWVCAVIERTSEYASLLAFLGLFAVNFIFAWIAAVYVTERFFVSDAQRKLNEQHVRWVNSLVVPARS